MLILLLVLHVGAALAAALAGRRLGPRVFLLAGAAPLATVVWAAARAGGVLGGRPLSYRVEWVGGLGLGVDLRFDAFSLLMTLLVAGVGTLIFVYARWYFANRPGLGRLAAQLVLFAGAMLGVVVADNLLLLYVFWELTSVTSYLLVGFDDRDPAARSAALQAILVTAGGGLAMLTGFVLVGQAAGTYSLSAIVAEPPHGAAVAAGLALVLLGALTKSAQVPFHFWLPGAMAAPTPVSAYLHSATMVKAGVYLVARLAPAFAASQAFWRPAVVGIGAASLLLGGYRALRQHDLKLLLAYGTVSQLGLMVILVGAGHPSMTFAGTAVILAHGMFKAALFLVVGIVDHQAHSRDLRVLTGLGRRMPAVCAVAALATASMAGIPPLLGFVAKEAVLEALLHDMGVPLIGAVVVGSALTFAYGARLLRGAFGSKRAAGAGALIGPEVSRPAARFVAPAASLALLSVVLGVWPAPAAALARGAARALDPSLGKADLYLWHGVSGALALSAVSVAGGVALALLAGRVERFQARLAWRASAEAVYRATVVGVTRLARAVTGVVQSGSLPVYLGVVLLTVLLLPGVSLIAGTSLPGDGLRLAESPLQSAVAAGVVVSAVGVALARRRFAAVLLLGAVGYGTAVLFVIQGAPDLALTQLLVETLAIVIFVLVLRHLPDRFPSVRWRLGTTLRLLVAGGVGSFVAAFALVASASRRSRPVSTEQVARALPEGGGRNVVNVILTDFRAMDTLGEITVLVVAALGISSLVLAGRQAASKGDRDGT